MGVGAYFKSLYNHFQQLRMLVDYSTSTLCKWFQHPVENTDGESMHIESWIYFHIHR